MGFDASIRDRSTYLRLSLFVDEDDGTAELTAQVFSSGFAGHGAAFFNLRDVDAFGGRLAGTFPIAKEQPIELLGGNWHTDGSRVDDVQLGLTFYPRDGRGTVGVRVQLVDPRWPDGGAESQARLAVVLTTQYEALRHFGEAVRTMAQSQCGSAELGVSDAE